MKKIILAMLLACSSNLVFAFGDIQLAYSSEIENILYWYNAQEAVEVKNLLQQKLQENCDSIFGHLVIEQVSYDVDLYVGWHTWNIVTPAGDVVAQTDVTFWQAPGDYKIENIDFVSESCTN